MHQEWMLRNHRLNIANMHLRPPIILAVIVLALLAIDSHAKTYRWVDANGRVHYSDRVPHEAIERERSRLDARGLEVEKIDRAKTAEELAQEAELKQLRLEEQRLIQEQRKKDRVLLRTFRSEDDILMTRDGKLTTIDASIQIIRSNIRRLKLKLAEMQKNAANLEREGKKISANYLKEIENTRQQLKGHYTSIIRKEQSKEVIRQLYAADLQRFQELKNLRPEQRQKEQWQSGHSLLETVVICSGESQCSQAWVLAEAYVRKHATTRLQMLADSIIMTASPLKDNDISITVSRIRNKERPGARLFMDLQCKESPRGRDFCETDEINQIRSGFREFLGAGKETSEDPRQGNTEAAE